MANSEFRPGRSIIAIGGATAIPLGVGLTVTVPIPITEAAQLGQLVITCWDAANSADLTNSCQVTEITHNNDLLLSTSANCATFNEASLVSPVFGHVVQVNDQLVVSVLNNSGIALLLYVNFTTI